MEASVTMPHAATEEQTPTTNDRSRGVLGWIVDGIRWMRESLGVVLFLAVLFVGLGIYGLFCALRWIHNAVGESKRTLIALTAVSIGSFWGLITYGPSIGADYSAFAAKLVAAVLGCNLFYVIIRYGHAKLDPIKQILSGNTAFVLYALLYAALIAVGFLAF